MCCLQGHLFFFGFEWNTFYSCSLLATGTGANTGCKGLLWYSALSWKQGSLQRSCSSSASSAHSLAFGAAASCKKGQHRLGVTPWAAAARLAPRSSYRRRQRARRRQARCLVVQAGAGTHQDGLQLHGKRHAAGNLELPHEEGLLRPQLAHHHLHEIVICFFLGGGGNTQKM